MRLVVVLLTRRSIYKYEMGLKWVWELSMDKFCPLLLTASGVV